MITFKKTIFILIISTILYNCSSDEAIETIDSSLLIGQWYTEDLCNSQNSLLFNLDNSYVKKYSGNTCDFNEKDTYKDLGSYTINGVNINFIIDSNVLIEIGIDTPTIWENELTEYIKIKTLTNSNLVIEYKTSDGIFFWKLYR